MEDLIKALEAFLLYADIINWASEGNTFVKVRFEADYSGLVYNVRRMQNHFHFETPKDLQVKSYILHAEQALEDGIPALCYEEDKDGDNARLCYGEHLTILYGPFREAVQTVEREHTCSTIGAVNYLMQVQHWHVDKKGHTFFTL